jgi:hypothetical protein
VIPQAPAESPPVVLVPASDDSIEAEETRSTGLRVEAKLLGIGYLAVQFAKHGRKILRRKD